MWKFLTKLCKKKKKKKKRSIMFSALSIVCKGLSRTEFLFLNSMTFSIFLQNYFGRSCKHAFMKTIHPANLNLNLPFNIFILISMKSRCDYVMGGKWHLGRKVILMSSSSWHYIEMHVRITIFYGRNEFDYVCQNLFIFLKGHWTTSASSPFFFFKKVEIFISLEVYTYVVTAC